MNELESTLRTVAGQPDVFGTAACAELLTYAGKEKAPPVEETHHWFLGELAFGAALIALKRGHRLSRKGWNNKGVWLELQMPNSDNKLTQPYIVMRHHSDHINTHSAHILWLASQTEILADDWFVVDYWSAAA